MEYDADSLTFFLAVRREDEQEEISVGSFRIGDPDFQEAISPPAPLKDTETLLVDRAVRWVAEALQENLRSRHGEDFSVYARVASPLASHFSAIPPDVFEHFKVSEWRRGTAVAEATGERLFSIHLVSGEPHKTQPTLDGRGKVPLIARFLRERYDSKRPSLTMDQLKTEFLAWCGADNKAPPPDSKTMSKGFRLAERAAREDAGI
jgi:hypothetical protein